MEEAPQWFQLREALRAHYEQWRVLTETEGAAIAANEWRTLAKSLQAKRQLQTLITSTTRELRARTSHGGLDPADFENEFRPQVLTLIEMEKANGQALAVRIQDAAEKKAQVDRVIHSLRLLRRAYVHGDPSLWAVYS